MEETRSDLSAAPFSSSVLCPSSTMIFQIQRGCPIIICVGGTRSHTFNRRCFYLACRLSSLLSSTFFSFYDSDTMSGKGYEHLLKILVIGDGGSCKTELLQRYLGGEDEEIAPTLGEKV